MDPLTSIKAMSRFFFSFFLLNAMCNGAPPCPMLLRMVLRKSTWPSLGACFIRRDTSSCICLKRRNTNASSRSRSGSGISGCMGLNKILNLRDDAKSQLGPNFILQDFHSLLLAQGQVPMKVLEKLIDTWIEESLAG